MVKNIFLVSVILLSLFPLPVYGVKAEGTSTSRVFNGVHLVSSDQTGIVLEIVASGYQIVRDTSSGRNFDRILIPGYKNASLPGELPLPMDGILLGVPPHAELELIILEDEVQNIIRETNLARNPLPARLQKDLTPGQMQSPLEKMTIHDDRLVPITAVRLAGEGWLREQRIVNLQISPMQYDPSNSTLLWHKRMLVKLRFVQDDALTLANQFGGQSNYPEQTQHDFEAVYASSLLNYEQAQAWRGKSVQASTNALLLSRDMNTITQPRIKIVVNEDGAYELTYADLKNAGFDVDNLDPRKLHLSSQGQDIAIDFSGQEDGIFDPNDAFKFYGQKFYGDLLAQRYSLESTNWMTYTHGLSDGTYGLWHPELNATMMEKYTDENVYWLEVGESNGVRMDTRSGDLPDPATTPTYFMDTIRAEQSHVWYTYNFSSEDTWFWDRIRTATTRTYTTTLDNVATLPISATIRAEVVARTASSAQPDHHTRFYINEHPIPIDEQFWHGISRYSFETDIYQSLLVNGTNELKLQVLLDAYEGQLTDDINFNWFEIEYARLFTSVKNQLLFSKDEQGETLSYEIGGFTDSDIEVYDITDPFKPKVITDTTINSGQVTFASSQEDQTNYYIFGNSVVQKPLHIELRPNAALKSPNTSAEYIFISHRDFINTTQTLADYRSSQGYMTMVVDVEDVYDVFNDGITNPIAIKNFLAYTFTYWQKAPEYALLVGDGHWNPKGFQSNDPEVDYLSQTPVYIPPNLSWVDPWQGEVDSANLLAAVVGDDPLPDLHIGRLPVNSVDELNVVIDKIITYENLPLEDWQYHVMFVADNNDIAGNFSDLADGIIDGFIPSGFQVNRLYFDNYLQLANPKESINQDIKQGLNNPGVSLLNYIGHASVDRWAHERIFTNDDIADLANGSLLPVLLSMDCLDGYWLHPVRSSLVEELLRAENRGIVSAFSPTGLGVATGHDVLQHGFYQAVFQDRVRRLGPATLTGKLALYASGSNYDLLHTFTIFGDPALEMKIPASPVYVPIAFRSSP